MRSAIGLLLVPVIGLGIGACASGEIDEPTGRPVTPGPLVADEPFTSTLTENARPLERPDTADIGQRIGTDDAVTLGRKARAHLDRLRAAGFR